MGKEQRTLNQWHIRDVLCLECRIIMFDYCVPFKHLDRDHTYIPFAFYLEYIIQIWKMLEEQLTEMRDGLEKLSMKYGVSMDEMLRTLKSKNDSETTLPNAKQENDYSKSKSMRHLVKNTACLPSDRIPNALGKKLEINQEPGSLLTRNLEHIENSLTQMNNLTNLILKDIVELMVTGKTFKIRQNFRGMALEILNLDELMFYVCHDSGRVEHQDFTENFITQIMENDPKCGTLEAIIGAASDGYHFVDLTDNSDLMKLFEIDSKIGRGKYFGVAMNCPAGEEDQSFSVCLMLKTKEEIPVINQMYERYPLKLLRKIIEISLISTSEDSKFVISKLYGKKMLDLLQILIIKTEGKLKRNLAKENGVAQKSYSSVTNLVKILLSKSEENIVSQQIVHMIRTLSAQFEEDQYRLVEQIRMYKKYVRETGITFLEFQQNGALHFISGNKEIPLLAHLNQVWEPGKPILNIIFDKNQKLSSHIKRTIRGCHKSQRIFEIDRDIKARVCMHNRKIQKIHIMIEDGDESIPSDSLKDQNATKTKKKDLDGRRSSAITIKQLELENPGISNQGWLDLFLKRNVARKEVGESITGKRNNTYLKEINNVEVIENQVRSRTLTFSHSSNKPTNFGMENIDLSSLQINVLKLGDTELEELAIMIFDNLDYFECLGKQKYKLKNFITDLHDHYEIHSNPFHNFQHGVNVMHTCYLLSTMPSNFSILSEKDIFAIVFSGLCHDVGHTGFTNAFQIASQSKKASIYNDRSPLENYHASLTFEILRKEDNNFFSSISREDFAKFRQAVIDNILFTDIKEHFPLLKRFNDLVNSEKVLGKDDCSIVSNMIVHCSDFGGSIKPFDICREWSLRVNTQFSNQYKVEGELGLPQTPFMKDLSNQAVLSKAEGGFLKVIVYPLYQALDKMYLTQGLVHKFKKNIQENIREWDQIHKRQTQKREQIKQ